MGKVNKKKLAEYTDAVDDQKSKEIDKAPKQKIAIALEKAKNGGGGSGNNSDPDDKEQTERSKKKSINNEDIENNSNTNTDNSNDNIEELVVSSAIDNKIQAPKKRKSSGAAGKLMKKDHGVKSSGGAECVFGNADNMIDIDSDDIPLNGSANTPKKPRKSFVQSTPKKIASNKNAKNGKEIAGKAAGKNKKGQQKFAAVGGVDVYQSNKEEDENEKAEDEEEEEYEVKEIINHKVDRGVSFFLIRWKGYTKDDDTWEPESTLSCPDLIAKFKKTKAANQSSKFGKKNTNASTSKPKKVGGGGSSGSGGGGGGGRNVNTVANNKKDTTDPEKEWEVEKIIDYAEESNVRLFRIRWKGFRPKHDTWEPESNLSCNAMIEKFMKRINSQVNVSFKELRQEPKKTKRLVNEMAPRTAYHNPIGRKSKRANSKKRVYYGDMDE